MRNAYYNNIWFPIRKLNNINTIENNSKNKSRVHDSCINICVLLLSLRLYTYVYYTDMVAGTYKSIKNINLFNNNNNALDVLKKWSPNQNNNTHTRLPGTNNTNDSLYKETHTRLLLSNLRISNLMRTVYRDWSNVVYYTTRLLTTLPGRVQNYRIG